MSTTLPAYSIITEGRVRRSRRSAEWHTAQSQPRVGTPIEVPLPRTVSVAFIFRPVRSSSAGSRGNSRLWRTRQSIRHFYIRHAHFVEAVLQEVLLGRSQVAFGFFCDQRQRIDGLPRSNNIEARLLALLVHQSQLQHRSHVKRG